jgi:hypothetical protein
MYKAELAALLAPSTSKIHSKLKQIVASISSRANPVHVPVLFNVSCVSRQQLQYK